MYSGVTRIGTLPEGGKSVEIVRSIVLGNIGGNLFLQFSYSIQIRSLQPSYLIHHF